MKPPPPSAPTAAMLIPNSPKNTPKFIHNHRHENFRGEALKQRENFGSSAREKEGDMHRVCMRERERERERRQIKTKGQKIGMAKL